MTRRPRARAGRPTTSENAAAESQYRTVAGQQRHRSTAERVLTNDESQRGWQNAVRGGHRRTPACLAMRPSAGRVGTDARKRDRTATSDRRIANVEELYRRRPQGRNGKAAAPSPRALAPVDCSKLISLHEVPSEKIEYLLPDMIALGSFTNLQGPKGEGKSTMMFDLAARLSAGKSMPFCNAPPITGGAILLLAEDDLGATVKDSIVAAGGVPEKIRVFSKRDSLYLDDPNDLRLIQGAAEDIDARLLVADPCSEFFRRCLKDEKVIRESFRPLRALAASIELAVVFIGHPTKSGSNSLYRGLGGVAVVNAARAALVVGHDPSSEDPYQHVLAFHRGNLPRTRDRSLVYRTVKRGDAIVIEWLGESKHSADDIVAAAHNTDAHSQLKEACHVLYSILTTYEDPMPATEVHSAAQEALVSVGTLKRAKKLSEFAPGESRTPICLRRTRQQNRDGSGSCPTTKEFLRPYREQFLREQEDQSSPGKSTTPKNIDDIATAMARAKETPTKVRREQPCDVHDAEK